MRYNMSVLGGTFKVSPSLHSARTLRVRQRLPARMQSRAFCLVANMENWKDIPGYEGRYQVSDQGRVRSLDRYSARHSADNRKTYLVRGKILAQYATPSGHMTVHVSRKWCYVHRIALLTFVCAPEQYAPHTRVEGRHLDGNPADNNLQNLAWGTVKENRADRRRLGEKSKLTKDQTLALQDALRCGALLKDVAAKYHIDRHTAARYRDGHMYG